MCTCKKSWLQTQLHVPSYSTRPKDIDVHWEMFSSGHQISLIHDYNYRQSFLFTLFFKKSLQKAITLRVMQRELFPIAFVSLNFSFFWTPSLSHYIHFIPAQVLPPVFPLWISSSPITLIPLQRQFLSCSNKNRLETPDDGRSSSTTSEVPLGSIPGPVYFVLKAWFIPLSAGTTSSCFHS